MDINFFDASLERFIRSLDESTIVKVLRTIDLLETFGGTRQSAIARLESGSYNPSLDFLLKVTRALDATLRITVNKN